MLYNSHTEQLARPSVPERLSNMDDAQQTPWTLDFENAAFPGYLLVRASGTLDSAFYHSLFSETKAYMAATVGLHGRYVPLIIDIRKAMPNREGLNALHRLVRQQNCRASHVILWISARSPNSAFQHSVALMLRAMLWNVHIVNHLDEALALLGLSQPAHEQIDRSWSGLGARFARWAP